MKVDRELFEMHISELISEGNKIISIAECAGNAFTSQQVSMVTSWVTQCGQALQSLTQNSSFYLERYMSILDSQNFYNIHSDNCSHLGVVLGCIKGLYHDYQKGLLNNISNLARAEIFGDFLEMAEYLLSQGYKDAAAIIIGSVLEDSLRKLSVKHNLSVENEDSSFKTIDPLNQSLYKAEVYDKLIQKQVTSWADLRNKAAHGDFEKYDANQVKMMLLFTQKFCSDYIN